MYLSRRNRVYYLWYTDDNGRKHKVSTRCRFKADAFAFMRTFRKENHQKQTRLKNLALKDFTAEFLAYSSGVHRPKTSKMYRTSLESFSLSVGDMPLRRIGVREIEAFLAKKSGGTSATSVRSYYSHLASAFEVAKRWGYIAANPFRNVPKPKAPEQLPVFFSREEFGRLMKAIPRTDIRQVVYCAVCTGMRLGEIISLKWPAVDFQRKVITIGNTEEFTTKSKRVRAIPMSEGLYRMLLEMRNGLASETNLVFHNKGRSWKVYWVTTLFKRYIRKANLDDRYHFHSLRHTFASWLAQDGVSLFAIQKLLGHSSSAITQVYSHLQPHELHNEVERISVVMN